MTFARDERHALCDSALAAGPDAPTLCEGWTVADLVAHLYVRENDPVAALGMFVPALAATTERRMKAAVARFGFAGLVETFRQGPGRWSVFRLPGVDEAANTIELYVHHEDIRRAADPVPAPRELGAAVENALWGKLGMAKAMMRKAPVGVVLEHPETGVALRARAGSRTVTLIGAPSELVLYVYGRQGAATVRTVGEPDAVAALNASSLGV